MKIAYRFKYTDNTNVPEIRTHFVFPLNFDEMIQTHRVLEIS
jgi:hypothetical protein